MKKKINVVSLFDGISCAMVALLKNKYTVENYYASEIDKSAIEISLKNFPQIKHVGGVQTLNRFNFPHIFNSKIDLLIGGSPCQDLSIAKKDRKGLEGSRSGLFWEYVRILKELKPKYFILENVNSMPQEAKDIITEAVGVQPIMINASLVSAQTRKRLFWTNIPGVVQPIDRGIYLKDILENIPHPPVGLEIKKKSKTLRLGGRGSAVGDKHEWDSVYQYRRTYWRETKGGKVPTLSSSSWQDNNKLVEGKNIRKLTAVECERLQCLPDNYTASVSNTQRYKALGNAFNADVVAHILKFMEK